MGIIRAVINTLTGAIADQWLEVIEPYDMDDQTVFTIGVPVQRGNRQGQNVKGTPGTVSNGSVIHVYENQFMFLTDGGKIVDYSAEPGYFKVDNSSMPSLFTGDTDAVVEDTFDRMRFGGATPTQQKVYYVNLQEIKGIKFGTRNPLNYFDSFYNAELFLRAFGTYSIKITDPLKFYAEAVPKDAHKVTIDDINEQYLNEFLQAFEAAVNKMSAEGQRISYMPSKGPELAKYMQDVLDESWREERGMEIKNVAVASISYDDKSRELINMRNQGAMLSDPNIRESYVQSSVAKGLEAAGSNPAGSGSAYMGMNMGMGAAGGFMASASETNRAQMAARQGQSAPAANGWDCPNCGHKDNTGKFCPECGKPFEEKGQQTR